MRHSVQSGTTELTHGEKSKNRMLDGGLKSLFLINFEKKIQTVQLLTETVQKQSTTISKKKKKAENILSFFALKKKKQTSKSTSESLKKTVCLVVC